MTENKQGTEAETTLEAMTAAEAQQMPQDEASQQTEPSDVEECQERLKEALDEQAALKKQLKQLEAQASKAGIRAFVWTLVVLIVLVAAYAAAHVATFWSYEYMHTQASDVIGSRQDLLVTVAVLEDQLDAPTALASPAVQAVLHDLERSVLDIETSEEVTDLFDATAKELTELGIGEEVSPKILEAARSRAIQFASASAEEREVPRQLFHNELEMAEEWALDALGAQTMLDRVAQVRETASGLGYSADSEVILTLAEITQELGTERPNRRLVAQLFSQVVAKIRGPQSLFWSHPGMRWLEVMAWSLAGMLVVRLWTAGKFIANKKFDAGWNSWWWAKIIQAPLLAVAVVLALSYLELGMTSGETLGLKISLRDQPVELVVAVSFILGLFSDKAYSFLRNLAENVLGREGEDEEEGEGEPEAGVDSEAEDES